MNICIESHVLNHIRRSGVMTYTEGLVYGLFRNDQENDYSLIYYSLVRPPQAMPGPQGVHFTKAVMKVPDRGFFGRQQYIDRIVLPSFFKKKKIEIFQRPVGYTLPDVRNVFKVLTVHDLRTLTIGDDVWMQNVDHYKKALSRADMCVVVSECTKADLIRHFQMSEEKIQVTYLAADKVFQQSPQKDVDEVRNLYGITGPFFLSVGSVPRKNIEGIIRGFAGSKYHKDYQLVLVYKFDPRQYQQLADELGIGRRLIFVNKVNDKQLIALYSGCHCFLFPSHYEGFGLPILEAMQCGAPVITSNVSSCPEVAGDAALLVDPKNIAEISEAVNQMCQNGPLRESLIRKGYEQARLFSWDKFAQDMKKIYAMA